MFHNGTRTSGGELEDVLIKQIDNILDIFISIVSKEVLDKKLRNAICRSMLPCNLIIVLDDSSITIAAQKSNGMPNTLYFQQLENNYTKDQIFESAIWDFGFDDPFILQFPATILNSQSEEQYKIISSIAKSHINSELNRFVKVKNMIQLNPIFGPASFTVESKSIFVLMPFTNELNDIYKNIIKSTIEGDKLLLSCRRADEINSNKAIIQDIFKGICEARIVIADLTTLNPNVMYELGIAHTVGKDTILIYQKNDDIKFPFDINHIRRIEYVNDASGGKNLENKLIATIQSIIN